MSAILPHNLAFLGLLEPLKPIFALQSVFCNCFGFATNRPVYLWIINVPNDKLTSKLIMPHGFGICMYVYLSGVVQVPLSSRDPCLIFSPTSLSVISCITSSTWGECQTKIHNFNFTAV